MTSLSVYSLVPSGVCVCSLRGRGLGGKPMVVVLAREEQAERGGRKTPRWEIPVLCVSAQPEQGRKAGQGRA